MTEADELAQLRKRVGALETAVAGLIVANMKLINANHGLIETNSLRVDYRLSNKEYSVLKIYAEVFDEISEDFEKINGP